MRFGFGRPAGIREQVGDQREQPLVGRVVLEDPEAFLATGQRLGVAAVLAAELGEAEVGVRRRTDPWPAAAMRASTSPSASAKRSRISGSL